MAIKFIIKLRGVPMEAEIQEVDAKMLSNLIIPQDLNTTAAAEYMRVCPATFRQMAKKFGAKKNALNRWPVETLEKMKLGRK